MESEYPHRTVSDRSVEREISRMRGLGYRRVVKEQGGLPFIDFYFNYNGYVIPEGDFGMYALWSSSEHPTMVGYNYVLISSSGDVDLTHRDQTDPSATRGKSVRCVR